MAGIGLMKNPSPSTSRFQVACLIGYSASFVCTWGSSSFLVASEIGSNRLREKTMAFGAMVNVIGSLISRFHVSARVQDGD